MSARGQLVLLVLAAFAVAVHGEFFFCNSFAVKKLRAHRMYLHNSQTFRNSLELCHVFISVKDSNASEFVSKASKYKIDLVHEAKLFQWDFVYVLGQESNATATSARTTRASRTDIVTLRRGWIDRRRRLSTTSGIARLFLLAFACTFQGISAGLAIIMLTSGRCKFACQFYHSHYFYTTAAHRGFVYVLSYRLNFCTVKINIVRLNWSRCY